MAADRGDSEVVCPKYVAHACFVAKIRSTMNEFWRGVVREAEKQRIKDSQIKGYVPSDIR